MPTETSKPQTLALRDPSLLKSACLIDGEWVQSEEKIAVLNPATGAELAQVPSLGADAAERAVTAAHQAWQGWRQTTAKARAKILRAWYEAILAHADDLALLLTAEHGKPLAEAKAEVIANAEYLAWFSEEAKRINGEIIPSPASDRRVLLVKQPVGVVAAITPWNFPNGMIPRKLAPALAAGCTMVLKPASQTPLSALALAELGQRVGLPKGVFNVITGQAKPIGLSFCHNPLVRKISFTGSTEVGSWLIKESADTVKKLSMELGGNAPFIVFDDADLDAAVEGALLCKYRGSGQTCICANRIYVQAGVFDAFTKKFMDGVHQLKVGNGMDASTTQGPLIDMHAVAKIESHIQDAVSKGAKLLAGGKRHPLGHSFFEPTVLTGVTQEMLVTQEETFAPLAPLIRFTDEAEVVVVANNTEFGLASYFYTQDLGRAWRVAEALESGMVGINTGALGNEMAPFGGIKQSGLGREGSHYGIDEYLELKYLSMAGL